MSDAPYGIIFEGDKKVYVGVPHTLQIPLTEELRSRIDAISDKYGAWYEGDGGDRGSYPTEYRGSWDRSLARQINGYPYEFIAPLFTNIRGNKQVGKLVSNKSIFDSIIANQDLVSYFKDRDFDAETLRKFLKAISTDKLDFLDMANEVATKQNVTKFLETGEKQMWPSNWTEYPNPAGKVAKKMEDRRNKFLLEQTSGAYFVGAGHIAELKALAPELKVIGGEKSYE
jgi:hypothetical protein